MAHSSYFTLPSGLLLTLLSIVIVGVTGERNCPHNGVNFRGRCFWFKRIRTTWMEAGHKCNQLYGDHVTLVTIKDRETSEFIRSRISKTIWIGLHEAHGETKWHWVDNTKPATTNFCNWRAGAPTKNKQANCAAMPYKSKLWRDVSCTANFHFVCAELPSAPMCPNGGIFFRDRCYWNVPKPLSWAAANQACQDKFGPETRLAVAKDAETNLFLGRLAHRNVWLGLSDKTEEGVWKWIDSAPLEYSNWFRNSPKKRGHREDCAILRYRQAKWTDVSCGDYASRTTYPYICAVPPCFQRTDNEIEDFFTGGSGSGSGSGSGDYVDIKDSIICPQTECYQHCVIGGACNATGQCICVRQFPGMTCDIDEWKMEMENEMVNITTGNSLTLKCKVNLPIDHISSFTWSKYGFFLENRTTTTKFLSQGYSTLQISGVDLEDAGRYECRAILRFSDTRIFVTRTALVHVTVPTGKPTTEGLTNLNEEASTPRPIFTTRSTPERTTSKETSALVSTRKPNTKMTTNMLKSMNDSKYTTSQSAIGVLPFIVILVISITLLLAAVVALTMRVKRGRFGNGMKMILHKQLQ